MNKKTMPQYLRLILTIILIAAGYTVSNLLAELVALIFINFSEVFGYIIYYSIRLVGFYFVIKYALYFYNKSTLKEYSLFYEKMWIVKLIAGLFLGIFSFALICIPLYLTNNYSLMQGTHSISILIIGFFNYIVVAFMEEILCRGLIQHRLLRIGPIPALFITSGIFSALHLLNPNFSLLAFINIFLAGTFIGASLYAGKNLIMPIGIHITWNWVQGSVLGIPVSGTNPRGYYSTEIIGTSSFITGGEFGAEGSIYCTIGLIIFTTLLLVYAYRSGNLAEYKNMSKKATTQTAINNESEK